MIFDGFVQKHVLLEKLACDAYMPNAAKIHNAMRCWRLLHLHTWSMPRAVDIPCTYTHGPRRAMLTQRFKQHRLARSFSGNWAPISTTEIGARFPAKPLRRKSVPNLSRAWGESSLLPFGCKLVCLQLGQIRGASTAIHHHLLHSHPLRSRPDQIQNPKSKLQTGRLDFGFWILDFGFWGLEFGFWILDFGFWILDFGFWILDFGSWILDFGFWILDFGFWILDFGFWSLDLGFWILDFGSWNFGFGILEFGVWILDFGSV